MIIVSIKKIQSKLINFPFNPITLMKLFSKCSCTVWTVMGVLIQADKLLALYPGECSHHTMPLDMACLMTKVFHTEADSSSDEYSTQVSGFCQNFLLNAEGRLGAFMVEAFPRSLGRRSRILNFGFYFLGRARANLRTFISLWMFVFFVDSSETWGSEI